MCGQTCPTATSFPQQHRCVVLSCVRLPQVQQQQMRPQQCVRQPQPMACKQQPPMSHKHSTHRRRSTQIHTLAFHPTRQYPAVLAMNKKYRSLASCDRDQQHFVSVAALHFCKCKATKTRGQKTNTLWVGCTEGHTMYICGTR